MAILLLLGSWAIVRCFRSDLCSSKLQYSIRETSVVITRASKLPLTLGKIVLEVDIFATGYSIGWLTLNTGAVASWGTQRVQTLETINWDSLGWLTNCRTSVNSAITNSKAAESMVLLKNNGLLLTIPYNKDNYYPDILSIASSEHH